MVPGAVLILVGLAVVVGGGGRPASDSATSTARGTDHPGAPETADVTGQ
jgi:hypothetical protein